MQEAVMPSRRAVMIAWVCAAVRLSTACAAESLAPPSPCFPRELVEFGPPSPAPLFAGGGPNAWDRDLRERGWIMRDDGLWHLWYTGSNADRDGVRRLGYATSRDGLNWTRCDRPLVDDLWVEDVCVVKACGRRADGRCGPVYCMFAEGEGDIAHVLTSEDRVHWRPRGPLDIRTTAGVPIAAGPRGTPAAWFDDGKGLWHLLYERMDRGVWLATSPDLEVFTNVSDEPVLACGPDAYDQRAIAVNQVIRYRGRWYAYYHASADDGRRDWSTCIAASDDLVRWEKYAGNPILPVDPDHPKRSSATLVADGRRHRLYTTHPDVRVRFSVDPVPADPNPK
jgi:hypothetical protein